MRSELELASIILLACGYFALCGSPSPAAVPKNTVFASVGWSEWCRPGYVWVDIDSGRFVWNAQLPRSECQSAKSAPLVVGELTAEERATLGENIREALTNGLVEQACREGRDPPRPVLSNAGAPYILVLSGPTDSLSAPNDLSCWSDAAMSLQRRLQRMFDLRARTTDKY